MLGSGTYIEVAQETIEDRLEKEKQPYSLAR